MRIVIILAILSTSVTVTAQTDSTQKTYDNSIYASAGFLLGPAVTLNYENTFHRRKAINYIRLGGGYQNFFGDEYNMFILQYGILSHANGNHHVEFALGPYITYPFSSIIPVAVCAGYRYQKPEGTGFFKISGGILEGAQLAVGVRF